MFEDGNYLSWIKQKTRFGNRFVILNYISLKQQMKLNYGKKLIFNPIREQAQTLEDPNFKMTMIDLFTKKSKGSKVFREVLTKTNKMDYKIISWEGKIGTKLCKGEVINTYRGLQNVYFPKSLLDMKLRLILGKTQFNDRLGHWANTGEGIRCYMCQARGDFAIGTLYHMLYGCISVTHTSPTKVG